MANWKPTRLTNLLLKGSPSQTQEFLLGQDVNKVEKFAFDVNGGMRIGGNTKVTQMVARVPLTAAQITGMNAAPQPIVAVPAAGQAIVVEQIMVELDLTATQFAAGGVVHFYYHGQTVELMAQTIPAATVIGSAGPSQVLLMLAPVATANGSVVTPAVGIDITNATGPFTTGTGTAVVTIWYDVVTLG